MFMLARRCRTKTEMLFLPPSSESLDRNSASLSNQYQPDVSPKSSELKFRHHHIIHQHPRRSVVVGLDPEGKVIPALCC